MQSNQNNTIADVCKSMLFTRYGRSEIYEADRSRVRSGSSCKALLDEVAEEPVWPTCNDARQDALAPREAMIHDVEDVVGGIAQPKRQPTTATNTAHILDGKPADVGWRLVARSARNVG